MSRNLDKLKKQHEYKMQLLKLQGEQKKESNKIINEITLDGFRAKKDQSSIVEEIRELKINTSKNDNLVKSGGKLLFVGVIATFISSLLTISGLWNYFNDNDLKLVSFISVILLSQFTVFILSKQISVLSTDFKQHLSKANILRLSLILVSVYGNYTFFLQGRETSIIEKLITFILCICIDVIAVFCVSIGNDFKTLNKNQKYENKIKVNEFVGKVKKLSKFVPKKNVEKQHTKIEGCKDNETNKNVLTFVPKKNAENKHTEIEGLKDNKTCTLVLDNDMEALKNTILSYKDSNICPSISALSNLTGFTKNKISEIKKELEKQGFIRTEGTKTYLQNSEMEG